MNIHLIDFMSTNQPTRQAAEHNLHLHMVLLDNLRTMHVSAKAMHCLFMTAIEKIRNKPLCCRMPQLTSGTESGSGSEIRSITNDETNLFGNGENDTIMRTELSYLDLLPIIFPDGEFSLNEQLEDVMQQQ
jgi:hypothetical protein